MKRILNFEPIEIEENSYCANYTGFYWRVRGCTTACELSSICKNNLKNISGVYCDGKNPVITHPI